MIDFETRFEWIDGGEMKDAALACTFGRLEIRIGDDCVTRAFDSRTRSMVNGVHVSLLPLAQWAIENWWTAFHESPRSVTIKSSRARSPREGNWHQRHGWFTYREGFSYPDVLFSAARSDRVRVDWFADPMGQDLEPLQFLGRGEVFVPTDVVRVRLRGLVDGVLQRCEKLSTPLLDALRKRWQLIETATRDEIQECCRAARLGLDAHDRDEVTDDLGEILTSIHGPNAQAFEDLLDVTGRNETARLSDRLKYVEVLADRAVSAVSASRRTADTLSSSRTIIGAALGPTTPPYTAGYAAARRVRKEVLGLDETAVGDAVHARLRDLFVGVVADQDFDLPKVRAFVAAPDDVPFLVMPPRTAEGERFARARALFVLGASQGPRLVTSAFAADQQASRAFAAELLAPAEFLRGRIGDESVGVERLDSLAAEAGVHPQLVRHQIDNHELAAIEDD